MKSATLVAAFAAAANAASFTNSDFKSCESSAQACVLTWSGANPVNILLKTGDSKALTTVQTIASNVATNSYSFTLPATLPSAKYAFEIDDTVTGEINYSAQFDFSGAAPVSSASSAASSSSSSSASSAASSTTSVTTTATSSSTTMNSSARPSLSITGSSNGTTTATTSRSPTAASATPSASTVPPVNTNDAGRFQSPLALLFLGAAAFFYLN